MPTHRPSFSFAPTQTTTIKVADKAAGPAHEREALDQASAAASQAIQLLQAKNAQLKQELDQANEQLTHYKAKALDLEDLVVQEQERARLHESRNLERSREDEEPELRLEVDRLQQLVDIEQKKREDAQTEAL